MRISQKLEYACRAAIQLAKQHDGNTPVRLEDLASREQIPSTFLVQILSDLKQANLVISKRGKAGGYQLARPPREITLAEVVNAIDSSLLEEIPLSEGESAPVLHHIWQAANLQLTEQLQEKTMKQLSNSSEQPMYYI